MNAKIAEQVSMRCPKLPSTENGAEKATHRKAQGGACSRGVLQLGVHLAEQRTVDEGANHCNH